MTTERIEIQVTDKVSTSVSEKLRDIAKNAKDSDASLKNLQSQLASIKVSTGLARLQSEMSRNSILQQRLQTEFQKTNAAMKLNELQTARVAQAEAKAATETSKLSAANQRAATEAQKLATEQQKTAKAANQVAQAQAQAATAAQRLTTEQQRTAAAAAQAAAASQRSQTAALGTAAAQERLRASIQAADAATTRAAAAQTRANTATTQGQTAVQNLATAVERTRNATQQAATTTQRLATEQQRTVIQSHNAAAASDRATLAALRLAAAQDRLQNASNGAASGMRNFVIQAAAAVGVSMSASGIIALADAYTVLQNKLVNVTKTQDQVNLLTDKLFDLANRTTSGIDATATAFARFDRSLMAMGKSQEDTLRMTETINKALKIGGATAQESASALLQLSQGFNSGKLQGEEFRAIAENMPMALDAVAKVMGVTTGQLKKMSSEGKITSKVLYDAFKAIEKEVDEKFGRTVITVAESVEVLKNKSIQFFGELNKATGFTNALGAALRGLGDHLGLVTAAVAIAGAALIVYFGPSLLTMLGAAAKAVMTLTLAIASNPIGLLVVGITAAIAAITLFGDKIKVSSDGLINLQDVALAVWSFITDAAGAAADFIKGAWEVAIGWISDLTGGWGDTFADVGGSVMSIAKAVGNFYISVWVGAFNFIVSYWSNFPALMKGFFAGVVNLGAAAVENLVNSWQIGLRLIAKGASAIAPEMASGLNSALDKVSIKIPRMDTSAGKAAASEVGKAFTDSFKVDYIGKGVDAIMKRAGEISKKRREMEGKTAELRGAGKDTTVTDEDKKAKASKKTADAAEKRASALFKVNNELDKELERMFMLAPQREAQARFDKIEQDMIQRKMALTASEASSIKAKIKAVQDATIIQKQFDRIYEESISLSRDYEATQTAAKKLLDMGAISQAQYSKEMLKSKEAYSNALDPLRAFNKDLDQQIELFKVLPQYREIEQQIMQQTNELLAQGIVLSDKEISQMRERLTLVQQMNGVAQAEASLMGESYNKRQAYIDQLTAINNLKANKDSGFTSADASSAVMSANPELDFTNTAEMFESNIARYEEMYGRIEMLRSQDLINEQTAATLRQRVWLEQHNETLNSAGSFFGQMSQLQKSENSKMAAVGKAAAIAQAMINTYQSATGAYSSMASIPYVGPALGAAAAAAAIAAGLANVQAIRSQSAGFMAGGYTGNMATNEVAGVVHGQEYVMTAASTNRIGVDNLQALQTGAASVQRNSDNVGNNQGPAPVVSAPNVNVPVTAVVVQSKEAAFAALNSAEGKALILETIEENGGTVARIVGAN